MRTASRVSWMTLGWYNDQRVLSNFPVIFDILLLERVKFYLINSVSVDPHGKRGILFNVDQNILNKMIKSFIKYSVFKNISSILLENLIKEMDIQIFYWAQYSWDGNYVETQTHLKIPMHRTPLIFSRMNLSFQNWSGGWLAILTKDHANLLDENSFWNSCIWIPPTPPPQIILSTTVWTILI